MPGDPAIDHFESDEFAPRPLRSLALEDIASHEVALFELDDPAEVRFERRGGVVDIISVQRHLRFEAKRVARAESAWCDAGTDDFLEQAWAFARRNVNFEAIFAGVTGARDDRRHAVDFAARETVILHR